MGNFTARTKAEASKAQQLRAIDVGTLARSVKEVECLDLTLLPTETTGRLCAVIKNENSNQSEFTVTDRLDDIQRIANLKTNKFTLRQAKFVTVDIPSSVPAYREGSNVSLQLKMSDSHSASRYTVLPDGEAITSVRTQVRDLILADGSSASLRDSHIDMVKKRYESQAGVFLFVGQHTLRLPDRIYAREDACFLGLPRGTTIKTKNGGLFTVLCRANVHVDSTGEASGHILLRPNNTEGLNSAAGERWAKGKYNGSGGVEEGYAVGSDLVTKYSEHRFLLDSVRMPYKNPLGVFSTYIGGLPLTSDMDDEKVFKEALKAFKFHNTKEELAEAMDDFLFG